MRQELISSKKLVVMTSLVFLILIIWNAYSSIRLHQDYQNSLMDSVTNNVLSEYQEHLANLRLAVDQFQFRNAQAIAELNMQGSNAKKADYIKLLNQLKDDIPDVRLFAIVDSKGMGTLRHITGDFLQDCKDEIHTTLQFGTQEHLFLHRSKTSVHYDLLQPLAADTSSNSFFFVAFNPTVFEALLRKYKLPFQQLFLLRSDNVGKIELSTEAEVEADKTVVMSMEEVNAFNFLKDIPSTRWQIAIRLAHQYTTNIIVESLMKSFILWLCLTSLIYGFYRAQKSRIRKQIKVQQALDFKDAHDELTGSINRSTFEQRLTEFLKEHSNQTQERGVVLLVDIDQFQLINNTYGYSEGDRCLFLLASAMNQYLYDNVSVSRLGNDEFAILLPELSHTSAQKFAEVLRQKITKLDLSEVSSDISLTASIGIIQLDGMHKDSESIFGALAKSVTLAKQKGRNRVQLYQSDDKALLQHAQEMEVVKDISAALTEHQFVLYRQSLKCLTQNGNTQDKKFEVLVRLKGKDKQIIAPGVFIPAAEKYGLITQLDRWVIKATFAAIALDHEDTTSHYSINLSGLTLADNDIKRYVKQMFDAFAISPSRIGFEITETNVITHLETAKDFIQSMIELGCEFSLDDFGSGLSSFSYLQELPVHYIKIDGAFVKDICENRLNQVFVESMHNVAKEMGKSTIAEFVEDEHIEQHLVSIGIDYAQGYHHHKPEHWFEYKD